MALCLLALAMSLVLFNGDGESADLEHLGGGGEFENLVESGGE